MDREPRPDDDLLAAWRAGDEGAFEALMRRHEDRIFSLALRMLGERSDALDATQDTFVALFRQGASFRGDSAFATWLYRVGINACKDLLRKRNRAPVPDDETVERALLGLSGPGFDEGVALSMDVAAALASLPDDYRTAVAMADLGGIPYEEIAVATRAPIGTVKSRISRGRRLLAEALEHAVGREPSKDQL